MHRPLPVPLARGNTRRSMILSALLTCLALAALAPRALAAETAVAPFVDKTTVAVVRADLSAVDLDATLAWVKEAGKAMEAPAEGLAELDAGAQQGLPVLKQWLGEFGKAGGKTVYLVVRMNPKPSAFLVIPAEGGGDPAKLGDMVKALATSSADSPFRHAETAVVGKAVVLADPEVLTAVKQITPAARPELDLALAAAGDGAVKAAYIPTAVIQVGLTFGLPQLPPELGGGPSTPLGQGVKWAGVGLGVPPKASVSLTVQASDAVNAGKIRDIADAGIKSLKAKPDFPAGPEMDKIIAAVTPQVQGDQLKVSLDNAKLMEIAHDLAPVVRKAQGQAKRTQSATNIRQIGMSVMLYTQENQGKLPDTVPGDIEKFLGPGSDRIFVNPQHPERKPAYVYVKPAAKIAEVRNPSERVILYEAHDAWGDGINVGFADGHVEFVKDQKQFEQMLANKGANP